MNKLPATSVAIDKLGQGPLRNPFSSRCIRPGAIDFVWPDGEHTARLVDRLAAHQWRGQIVGPHGTGKSTLLQAVTAELDRREHSWLLWRIAGGQRQLPDGWAGQLRRSDQGPAPLVIVDGYEQLGWFARQTLGWNCQAGLLVTSHRSVGLPMLWQTVSDVETAIRIVRRLEPAAEIVSDQMVADCLARNEGNIRETLFALYDHYERCRR